MTLRDRQKKIADRLNKTRETIEKNIMDMLEKSAVGKSVEKQIAALQANIEKTINLTLLGLNVATRDQIDYLDKKIDMVNAKVDKLAAKSAPGKKAAKKKTTAKRKTTAKKQ